MITYDNYYGMITKKSFDLTLTIMDFQLLLVFKDYLICPKLNHNDLMSKNLLLN